MKGLDDGPGGINDAAFDRALGVPKTKRKAALTADTVTEEQIRELRAQLGSATYPGSDDDAADCHAAVAAPVGSLRRIIARARCAEIINARRAQVKP